MRTTTIRGIALLACLPAAAFASSGIALNPDTILRPLIDGQVRFDDNVELLDNGDGDTVFVVSPGLELIYNGGLSKGAVNLTEQFIRYGDNGQFDGELFSGLAEYSYEGALTNVTARGSYRELSQGSVMIRNREQAVRHDTIDGSLNAVWSATAKTRIGVGAFYSAINYPGSLYADYEAYGAPVDFYYAATPKVDVSLGYRYRRSLVAELPTATRSADSTDHFFNVGARGEFTPKLKGQFRFGYGVRRFDEVATGEDESKDQFSFSGTLVYSYSPKTSFDLTASNDFATSALGLSQEILALRVGGKFEFTPQWSAIGGLSFQSSDYETSRRDDFFVGDAGVVYAMNENVSFHASYTYRTNDSSVRAFDFSNNILSLGVSLRY